MAANDVTPTDGRSTLSYAAATVPVVQGALALIVITFVGQVWSEIDVAKRNEAFELIYACGAHFIFSFGIAGPAALFLTRIQQGAVPAAFTVGIYAYTFWSLNVQHRSLAHLMLDEPWTIPFGNDLWALFVTQTGVSTALYLSPLIFGYMVAFALLLPLQLLWPRGRKGGE